ncbi:hypothetical protein [Cytobacillus gottheilii]|uniref:PrcB C-terminal domain-containing protein n=1 Tax=Cytobacillus gottheilii TaxID=859144 RepID=A0ABX8FEI3_9BACI|nr:hypothetical protein [Cytobacillus gottheilii]QVY62421.1 hypothetical protein J1899_04775 [Cytobacillus gottheilii]
MNLMKSLLFLALCGVLLLGCGKENQVDTSEAPQIDYELIASEKTLPANFDEIAYEREESPAFQYLIKAAYNPIDFEQLWNLFDFEKKIPKVDFESKNVMIVGLHESSCPTHIEEINNEQETLTINVATKENTCDELAAPRAFVIELDKGISESLQEVMIVESEIKTIVPIQ